MTGVLAHDRSFSRGTNHTVHRRADEAMGPLRGGNPHRPRGHQEHSIPKVQEAPTEADGDHHGREIDRRRSEALQESRRKPDAGEGMSVAACTGGDGGTPSGMILMRVGMGWRASTREA
jgi:hypothetical protein